MALTLPGHSAPAVGFEVPLEMLAACHGRVQHQCKTLLRLVTHLQTHGADRPAQEAANAVMRYFDTAARHHHEDEEQDLFPALLESMATRLLSDVELDRIGLAMRSRRGAIVVTSAMAPQP